MCSLGCDGSAAMVLICPIQCFLVFVAGNNDGMAFVGIKCVYFLCFLMVLQISFFLYLVNIKRFLNGMMECRVSSIIPLGVHGTGISREAS